MSVETKTISGLEGYRFLVPSYQRGYRWTEHEVTALLDDIEEFSAENAKRYCIQPLIVKRRYDGSFEVVDGQQRLTTIYIFMKIAEEITNYIPFELQYETRKTSQKFLAKLAPRGDIDDTNIDYFHITKARKIINDWLDKRQPRFTPISDIFNKLTKAVFFIWSEMPPESDPITMFTKVNLGKIPLTNAELIKALILNKENFSTDIHKRQIEISLAWDRIEQGLHDDSFWYFLNEKEQDGTRIDMIFDLLAHEENFKSTGQEFFPFLVFFHLLKKTDKKNEFVKELWTKVEKLYAEFRDWYADLDKYHIIGFLISSGVEIADIFKLTRGKRKSELMCSLLEKAGEGISINDLSEIAKGSSRENKKIRQLLLLFNIATLVCKSEKQYRFPFDIYKGESAEKVKWDIEHIHATADETGEHDDSLGNLTLLDSRINRSPTYAAKPFEEKRRVIIERESKGLFVPICTKNIFLKVYSLKIDDMTKWEEKDKKDYIEAMGQTLQAFLKKV